MHTFTVAGYQIRGLLDGLRALQLDVDQLLRDCHVDRASLDDPEMRFTDTQAGMLWMYAEQRYGKPSFGFDLTTRIPFGKLELIDYLVAACPSVGSGIECLVHHARLCASGFTYRIEDFVHDGEHGKRLLADHHQPLAALPFSMAEYTWGSLVARFRLFCSKDFRPVLWLRQRPQVSSAELVDVLGRVPEIGAEEALFVSNAQWQIENPRRDAMLHKLLLAHARDVASRLPASDFLSTLQGAIVSTMHQGDPSIGRVAMRLALTPRTLQRRLEAEGLSFQDVLEELRQEMALRYLTSTQLSLTEISAMLAYADSSAFGRAFRRWTGHTPAAFRQQRQQQDRDGIERAPLPGRNRSARGGLTQALAKPG
jgi:AraC-like DNA-binding protein